jgi:RNA polymerase sigma-70 factor, ECF subfamily
MRARKREPAWDWTRLRGHSRREAGRLMRDPQDAEDVTQEAMARAWRQRHRCHTPERPVPWVLQITRNEAYRLMERARSRGAQCGLDTVAEIPSAPDPEREHVHQRVDVRRALGSLSTEDRLLVGLRYEEDLAQPRIAGLLRMPEGTIKVRLHRIRKRLAPELEGSIP